ncbi:GPW/gp25 family protein [Metapseudomonas furukawaii]|uniref:Phage baseplate assembly protein n=1 Tax=Metapseudomonas furukawaii TaxID=1149133 RepID=A0AAD1C081_METFU|nr:MULTISPECIES: GPW/gp25 family protein [Pseudomonas]ELS26655.1 GPW/gp25 [Pseudomonas furukawaii]OWJ92732.1 baseplate assembly protein [Pseudomonas sp. A46]BAU74387.1 phage baseplate assembly protein [Pseudomonas furukawaii]
MNRHTGFRLDDVAHLRQSIADILTTPLGSRLMRRDYGSRLFQLLDHPLNPQTRLRAYAATALALMRWEPRLHIGRIQLEAGSEPGRVVLTLEGARVDSNERLNLQVPLRFGGSP